MPDRKFQVLVEGLLGILRNKGFRVAWTQVTIYHKVLGLAHRPRHDRPMWAPTCENAHEIANELIVQGEDNEAAQALSRAVRLCFGGQTEIQWGRDESMAVFERFG